MSPSAFIWTASGGQHQPSRYASTGHSTAAQLAVYYNSAYSIPPDENHSRSSTPSFDNDFSGCRSFTRPKLTWPSYGTSPPYSSRIIEISDDDDDDQPRPNSSVEYVPYSPPPPVSRPVSQDDQQQPPHHAGEYHHAIPPFGAADVQPRVIRSGSTPAAPPSSMVGAPSDTAEGWQVDNEWALQTIYDRCLRATKIYLSPAVAGPNRLSHHRRRRRRHNPYRRRRSTAVPAATPSLRENVWRIADLFWHQTRRDGAIRGADADTAARMASLLRAADAVVFGEDAACVAADAASLCDALGDREGSRLVLDVAAPWIEWIQDIEEGSRADGEDV